MKLVDITEFGIKGMNYYWERRDKFGLSLEELRSIGVNRNTALVDQRLIPNLQAAQKLFKENGYDLFIKDGYRSPELYLLVQKKRYERDGKENTDKTFDPVRAAHASGLVVDISLLDINTGKEVDTWNRTDWPDGTFINFYKLRTDERSKEYQRLQDLMAEVMLGLGFVYGLKREFWHFEDPILQSLG